MQRPWSFHTIVITSIVISLVLAHQVSAGFTDRFLNSASKSLSLMGVNSLSVMTIQNNQREYQLFELIGAVRTDSSISIAGEREQDINIKFDDIAFDSVQNLSFPLLDGKSYTAVRDGLEGFERHTADSITWRGKIYSDNGFSGDVVLSVNGKFLSGLIYSPGAVYEIIPQADLKHLLVELDQRRFPACGGAIPATDTSSKGESASANPEGPFVDDGSQIDVLVTYTASMRQALGGTVQAQVFAQQAIDSTNTAYINSGINPRVRLVGTLETNFDEAGGTVYTALDWVDSDPTVATARESTKADMVSIIVENGGDYCGVAYLMTDVSPSFAPLAFSAIVRSCAVGNLSFAHELGHNQAAHHDPANASGTTAYPYAYGHKVNSSFSTVMAYANGCPDGCSRVAYFSNPLVNYGGFPTGITDQRDNHRVLNNTALTISQFRDGLPNTPTNTPTNTATGTATPTGTPMPSPTCVIVETLDTSFDGDGKVVTSVGFGDDRAGGVAVQPNGKIVAVGYTFNGVDNDFAVVRYNSDGSLDTLFDGDGKVTTPVSSFDDEAHAVAIQSDGKIVAAGSANDGVKDNFAIVRYNIDGSLDTSFDGDGIVTTSMFNYDDANSLAIQPDGKIIVAGRALSNTSSSFEFAIARYNPDGSLDSSFDGDGKVITPVLNSDDTANSLVITSDGKVVVAGYTFNGSNSDFALVRYNSDGSLDNSFDGDGKAITPVLSSDESAQSVAIQMNGKIIVSGRASNASDVDFALVRYNSDGSLDNSFDGDGKTTTSVSTIYDSSYSVGALSNGKIVAAGLAIGGGFAIVRYNTDGSLDNSFDGDGMVTTPVLTSSDEAHAMAIQPDGKIVAAGYAQNGSNTDFALVRYSADCLPPSISGTVTYGNAQGSPPVRFVSNVLMSGAGSVPVSIFTAGIGLSAGQYMLTGFGAGTYTVTPSKTGGVNVAISSFDAARIAQHVTSVIPLTGNQLLVADVSNNGGISSFDAAQVASYSVSNPGSGLSGTWKFVPVNKVYASVASNFTGEDYSALLMGEVSGNWTNTGARPAGIVESGKWKVESEDGGPARGIAIELPTLTASSDKEIIVPVSVQGIANKGVISYEFDLRYDASVMQPLVDPVDVKDTASRGLSVVTNATEPGLLRVVVYGAFPIDENGVLLNLRFTAVGAAGSVSPLTFERILFNEGEPRVTVFDGLVEISASTGI